MLFNFFSSPSGRMLFNWTLLAVLFHNWESEEKKRTVPICIIRFIPSISNALWKWRAFGQDNSFFLSIRIVSFCIDKIVSFGAKKSSLLRFWRGHCNWNRLCNLLFGKSENLLHGWTLVDLKNNFQTETHHRYTSYGNS